VKLDDQSPMFPLDNEAASGKPINSSLWFDGADWETVRDELLKPITDKMFDERTADNKPGGTANPNLMRFLLLKKEAEESWPLPEKNYRLYRLHYLEKDKISILYKKALSRFLNPAELETTDAQQLTDWVDSQNHFGLAKYLGQADEKHKDFYRNFKTWFQELSLVSQQPPNVLGKKKTSSGWMIFWVVLFFVVITIVGLFVAFPNLFPVLLPRRQHDDEYMEDDFGYQSKSPKTHPSRFSPAERQRKSAQHSSAKTASLVSKEMELLKEEVLTHRAQLQQLQSGQPNLGAGAGNEQQALEQRFTELFDQNISRYLSQNGAVQKTVNAEIERSMAHVNSYLNDKFREILDNKIDTQVKYYWEQLRRENQLNETAPAAPTAYLTNSKSFKQSQGYQPPVNSTPSRTPSRNSVAPQITNQSRQRQPSQSTGNEVIDNIKSLLLSMKSVDEAALNALDTNVETGSFVTQVVANCLKSNQPATHYQRLDDGIQELTDNRVSLIIPNLGDDIRPEEHNAMSTQTATKGKLNTIASLLRPGVICDSIVRRKAEVIQTI